MRRWILGFITVWLLAFGQQVCARDDAYILSHAYYLDESNALTIREVERETFTPYQDVLTGGFKSGTYWLRLKIHASDEELALKIRPFFTEEIELFDPVATKVRPLIGAKFPWASADIEALSYNFVLPPSAIDRDVYLRVKSTRSYLVYAEAMTLAQFHKADRAELLIYGAYCTFALMLGLWLLITWLMNRELVLGVFMIQQFIAFLHTMLVTGLARWLLDEYISPLLLNSLLSLVAVTYPFIAFLANKFLLTEYGLKSTYKRLFNLLLLFSTGVVGLYLSGSGLAFKLNNMLILVGMLFFWVSAFFGVNLKNSTFKASALPISTLRLFYTFNVLIWMVTILPYLGLINLGELTLYTIFFYNMLSGLVFFFVLQYRAKSLLKLETARSNSLEIEAEQERRQREEQDMLMAMLSHEIKTPLSVLKLVVDEKVAGSDLEGHANRAVNNIDFIVERCLQLGKLDAEAVQVQKEVLDCQAFLSGVIADHSVEGRVRLQCPAGLKAKTDPGLLRVVLSNLLENALKYAPAGSTIDVGAAQLQQDGVAGVRIVVASAVGMMGAPDPAHVFKKYYRNNSATKISGSGLGLFLVHELVAMLGGTVTYQPAEDRVLFSVWIPH